MSLKDTVMTNIDTVGILGAGAWGTALAFNAHKAGRKVKVVAREPEVAQAMSNGSGNPLFLPNVKLPAISSSCDVTDLLDADTILAVVPAQFSRKTFQDLAPIINDHIPIVLCSKGIEQKTLSFMTDVLAETIPNATPAVLSGPSFAIDVAKGLPTAVTLACQDAQLGETLMKAIGRPTFRPYWTDDLIGTEIGGAVKNVLAIACGIVEGLGLGKSAHAALIARGFAEMTRIGIALGARLETLTGLSGLGDLVLTCSSSQSRNMSFGKAIGEGSTPEEILASRTAVTEGATSAPGLVRLAEKHNVEMPISSAVAEIVAGRVTVSEALDDLLSRPFTTEI